MKNIPCKDGIIYHYVKKYRRRRLVTVLILVLLLCVYAFFSRAYLANAFAGASELNTERFAKEVQTREVGEEFELHRSESVQIDTYALKAYSYWQDIAYEFDVRLENPQSTGIVYTTQNTDPAAEDLNMESAVLYTADIGGITTLVLAYPHNILQNGDTVCGVFTRPARIIEHDIAKSPLFDSDSEICAYVLDTRGISMESQFADIVFCTLLLLLILYLLIRLICQYVNPLFSPTYRGIDKYGNLTETVTGVEKELSGKVTNCRIKGKIVTDNWIITKDTFKLKIVKNHMKKH